MERSTLRSMIFIMAALPAISIAHSRSEKSANIAESTKLTETSIARWRDCILSLLKRALTLIEPSEQKIKVGRKTIRVKGIINDDSKNDKYIEGFYERVLDSQLSDDSYYRVFF